MFHDPALSWPNFLVPRVTKNRMILLLALENIILLLLCLNPSPPDLESQSRSLHKANLEAHGGLKPQRINASSSLIVNSDIGDPVIFEPYWRTHGDDDFVVIPPWNSISYLSGQAPFVFYESSLDQAIRSLHKFVGNAVVDGRYIVIGAGSSQLLHAALYALASCHESVPLKVVSASPFYSVYPIAADLFQSKLYEWGGDALEFDSASNPHGYIEIVNYPNNPDGMIRDAVVNGTGYLVHDLPYYWPQFTPIIAPADHDIMLFTLSKITGHAGSRLGWAIVKDWKVAQLMLKFSWFNTIGVSRDVQFRGASLLRDIVQKYTRKRPAPYTLQNDPDESTLLFHHFRDLMENRWHELREIVSNGDRFTIPNYPPAFCTFFGIATSTYPAFAWLKCEKDPHCEELLKSVNVLGRGADKFGVADTRYVRLSMMHSREEFTTLLSRLALLSSSTQMHCVGTSDWKDKYNARKER